MGWLLNFSASRLGGGLKRLTELSRWFAENGGAQFLVHAALRDQLSREFPSNRYFGVALSKWQRLIADGEYLRSVLGETGVPDVYFSYGIPLFERVGRVNWLHASNALTLTFARHEMGLKRYAEHQVLGHRLRSSLQYAQIASAESEFSLDLLRRAAPGHTGCHFVVSPNGCDALLEKHASTPAPVEQPPYAITVGTWRYKRLALALEAYHELKKSYGDLSGLRIVGECSTIPNSVKRDPCVQLHCGNVPPALLYPMIKGALFYISASSIENSSNAALEGLMLAQNCLLSDIPSHQEMVRGIIDSRLPVPGTQSFLLVHGSRFGANTQPLKWSDVALQMHQAVEAIQKSW